MDWMVTDERLSASVQSWTTDRERDQRDSQSGLVGSSQSNSIGSAAQSSVASGGVLSLPGTMGLQSSSATPGQPVLINPTLGGHVHSPSGESAITNYPRFTQLATPPASPAPSPGPVNSANPKRLSLVGGGGMVSQLFQRQTNTNRGDPDLEKGENELSGMNNINNSGGSSSGSRKLTGLGSRSESSNADVANRLFDAMNSQFYDGQPPKPDHSGGSVRSSFSQTNSFKTVRHNYINCKLALSEFLFKFDRMFCLVVNVVHCILFAGHV